MEKINELLLAQSHTENPLKYLSYCKLSLLIPSLFSYINSYEQYLINKI